MEQLIEFKLHNGKLPYFVKDCFNGVCNNGRYYGISRDTTYCYLPKEVIRLDKSSFIDKLTSIEMKEQPNFTNSLKDVQARSKSKKEKEILINNWLFDRNR